MPIALFILQTQPPAKLGLLELFAQSGPIAKIILAILLGYSIASWAVLLRKAGQLRRADRESREFLDAFRKSQKFSEANAAAGRLKGSPLAGIFQAGYAEIDAQIKAANPERDERKGFRIHSLPSLERSLKRAIGLEVEAFARGAALLGTTAAATPFIGLFGTVWGIMVAFSDIGATGSTSIVAVAPGIAEALINTAAGLFAAIPALIGHNWIAGQLKRLRGRMEDFALEFLNLAERNFT